MDNGTQEHVQEDVVAFYLKELTKLMNQPDSDTPANWETMLSYIHQILGNTPSNEWDLNREVLINVMLTANKYNIGLLDKRKKNMLERSKRRGQYAALDSKEAKIYNQLFHVLAEATTLAYKRAINRKRNKVDKEPKLQSLDTNQEA